MSQVRADTGELTESDRLWLAANARAYTGLALPAAARDRLRRMDLITTQGARAPRLTRLGLALALRLKQQLRRAQG